jgi:hypothetical protein
MTETALNARYKRMLMLEPNAINFDGFYLMPGDEDRSLKLSYFDFLEDFDKGKKVGATDFGDMYHVIFFRQGEEGEPVFDDHFEAIFGDPETYVHGLIGANVFGCFVRKTENSYKWVDDYLKRTLSRVTLLKLKNYAKEIAEN